MSEQKDENRTCDRCGKRLRLAAKVFNPKLNREARLYNCESGHLLWDEGWHISS